MRLFTFLGLVAVTLPLAAQAQRISTYAMAASGSSAAAYAALQPTTTAAARTAGTYDEGYYNNLPIGFSFKFGAATYTTLSASTNGFLVLGAALTSATPTNNLTSGTPRPLIAPLWDDLSFEAAAVPANPAEDGNLFYQTTGTAPNRLLTIEWRNVRWSPGATGPVCSFLVQLEETTNVVRFDYLQGSTSAYGSTRSASAGLAGSTSADFLSLSDLQLAATVSSTTETTTISSRATSGRIYTFTPPGSLATAAALTTAGWQLAPNPAAEQVRLSGHDARQPVQLLDAQGRLVRTVAPAAEAVLDVRGLAPGLYLVRVGPLGCRLAVGL